MNADEISRAAAPADSQPFALSSEADYYKNIMRIMERMPRIIAGELGAYPPTMNGNDSDDPAVIMDAGINAVLAEIGTFFGVSRAVVMLEEKEGRYLGNTYEWVDEKISEAIFSWSLHDYEKDIPSLKPLMEGREFLIINTREAPPDLQNVLLMRSVASVLQVPLLRDGIWMGLAAFDSCGVERIWREEEIIVLKQLARLVTLFIERLRYAHAHRTLCSIRELINTRQITHHMSLHDADELYSLVSEYQQ